MTTTDALAEPGTRRWSRLRTSLSLIGPAFVAAVAYVDPGNVATNVASGARFGYLLVWVLVSANITAMLVQYLSAKLSIATGKTLAEMCRDRFRRPVTIGMWLQGEVVAIATDLAEVIGGAVALYLLFDVPLVVGGVITGAISWLVLAVQSRRGQRPFEGAVIALLLVVFVGFCYGAVVSGPSPAEMAGGMVPRLAGTESMLLAAGILGATVMPHAIYLHGALVRDRHGSQVGHPLRQRRLLGATRVDVVIAMSIAGTVNLAMLVAAAAALTVGDAESLTTVYQGITGALGETTAVLFALGLLASGFASTSVGTYAGAVIMEGFLRRRIPLTVRRGVTLLPAIVLLASGLDPGYALVISQVILSFGIPFALWPLVWFTARRLLMGAMVNRRITTLLAVIAATFISALNLALVWLTFTG